MAWFGKNDKSGNKKDKQAVEGTSPKRSTSQTSDEGKSKGQRPESADIRAQALANARAARERLGDETIQKIAEIIKKKENSPTERAKREIAKITENEADRVAAEILNMLETRH